MLFVCSYPERYVSSLLLFLFLRNGFWLYPKGRLWLLNLRVRPCYCLCATQRYIVFHWRFCLRHICCISLIYIPLLSKFVCTNCTIAVPIQYSGIFPLVILSVKTFYPVHILRIACILSLCHTWCLQNFHGVLGSRFYLLASRRASTLLEFQK